MLRLRTPTHRQVHILWLIVAAVVAAWFTRGTVLSLFLALFLIVWLLGYLIIAKAHK